LAKEPTGKGVRKQTGDVRGGFLEELPLYVSEIPCSRMSGSRSCKFNLGISITHIDSLQFWGDNVYMWWRKEFLARKYV
jgi:hypothetical protein